MKKYNYLFITSDQQHFNTIGKFNPEIHTPNLDRLCETGTYFDRAYTVNPTCTPTRASMITGKYPSQHGAWTLGTKLPESCETIGGLLQKNGFKTALVGKAHFQQLNSTEEFPSLESYGIMQDLEYWKNFKEDFYGFETVKLARNHTFEAHVGQHYALWLEEKGLTNWKDYFAKPTGNMEKTDRTYQWEIPEEYHYNAWIAEETTNLLETYNENDDNFMLWASFFDPHPPYMAPSPWDEMYKGAELSLATVNENEMEKATELHKLTQESQPDFSKYKGEYAAHGCNSHLGSLKVARENMESYYSMVSLMDKYIGKIVDKLDALGMAENTIIVFTTDHGHFFGQHGLHAKGPFMYEDLIKVPMIVRCPNTIPENIINSSLQSIVDIPVTMLHYLDTKVPYDFTGLNQMEVWEGKKDHLREEVICEFNHEYNKVNLRAFVNERYKLVVTLDDMYGELYDLENDPYENNNLWDDEEYKTLKNELLMKYVWAELRKESLYMPRVAHA